MAFASFKWNRISVLERIFIKPHNNSYENIWFCFEILAMKRCGARPGQNYYHVPIYTDSIVSNGKPPTIKTFSLDWLTHMYTVWEWRRNSEQLNQIVEKPFWKLPQFSRMIELLLLDFIYFGSMWMNISVESTKWIYNINEWVNAYINIFVKLKYSTSFRMRLYE